MTDYEKYHDELAGEACDYLRSITKSHKVDPYDIEEGEKVMKHRTPGVVRIDPDDEYEDCIEIGGLSWQVGSPEDANAIAHALNCHDQIVNELKSLRAENAALRGHCIRKNEKGAELQAGFRDANKRIARLETKNIELQERIIASSPFCVLCKEHIGLSRSGQWGDDHLHMDCYEKWKKNR